MEAIIKELKFKGICKPNQRFDCEDLFYIGTSPLFDLWDPYDQLQQYHIIMNTGPEVITGLKSTWVAGVERYERKVGGIFAKGTYLTQAIKDTIELRRKNK